MAKRTTDRAGLSASTTIPLGVAAVCLLILLGATVSGAWWAAAMSIKVDDLSNSSRELKTDMNNVKNDVGSIKFDVKSVQSSVNQLSSETVKSRTGR